MYSLYLHVSANLYGHYQVVVKIHLKNSVLGRSLPFKGIKYDILVSWLLFRILEEQ